LPESRYKYLFERLGDHNFQLLVNALLTERFTDFVPLPLRQADGETASRAARTGRWFIRSSGP
jgi:hypothetical protein